MFDKLVESNTAGAEFKNRSRYFMVSSVVVGILFATAVVYSLYAAEIGLGNGGFDIAEMIAPITAEAPVPVREQPAQATNEQQQNLPTRRDNLARIDEPNFVPDRPSSDRSNLISRPVGRFLMDRNGADRGSGIVGPVGVAVGRPSGTGSRTQESTEADVAITTDPPPIVKPKTSKPTSVSEGVINGKATYLPIPAYPAPAKAVNASGVVSVQVTIDESGRVVSAKAVSGHPLLRPAAEKAAWGAKFSTTYLSRVPVKVTGVIVYNFKRD